MLLGRTKDSLTFFFLKDTNANFTIGNDLKLLIREDFLEVLFLRCRCVDKLLCSDCVL